MPFALAPIVQVLIPGAAAFAIGMLGTPILTHYLYAHKAWKKNAGKRALNGETAHEFNRLHTDNETRAPRMGGIVVWASVAITILGIALLAYAIPASRTLAALNFFSRKETWLPFAALMVGAGTGFIDDLLTIAPKGEGMRLRSRIIIVIALSFFIGWWFYAKLAVAAIGIPFGQPLEIGWLIVPLFILVSLALYASGVIDGIDGLSGGVFGTIFAAYAIIAFAQGQTDLAAFCACVVGGLLAFLWFNIPPARFYMSDTGTMALTLALAVVAFMTDDLGGGIGLSVLPIIGGLLLATVVSDVLQVLWKKLFGKKLFRIAPLHHHFEAIGWAPQKVVMRYWVLSVMLAFAGVILALAQH